MKANFLKALQRSTVRGSLLCLSLIMLIAPQTALAGSGVNGLDEPRSMDLEKAKNGVVRVVAVTEDEDGNEKVRAVSSGFIVSMEGSSPYVVTTLHAVDFGDDTTVRVIIKNDTFAEARIDGSLKSREKDLCILSVDSQLGDKNAIPLRVASYEEEEKLAVGDEVTLLGFSSGLGSGSDFSADDVTAKSGKITKMSGENGGYYSADTPAFDGADGGVLVDQDGYAIGLVNTEENGSGSSVSALDVAAIEALLESEDISFRTRDKDLLYNELYELFEFYTDNPNEFKKADSSSQKALSEAYNEAYEVLSSSSSYDRASLARALSDFQDAAGSTTTKAAGFLNIIVIVLGVLIIALLVRLILLKRWYRKNSGGTENSEAPEKRKRKKDKAPKKRKGRDKPQRAAPEVMAPPRLRICRTGEERYIAGNSITIGKSGDSDIVISNNKVSRHHALIENIYGSYYLFDQNSTNGTFLNDIPVNAGGVRLMPGDIIRLADEQIEFIQ